MRREGRLRRWEGNPPETCAARTVHVQYGNEERRSKRSDEKDGGRMTFGHEENERVHTYYNARIHVKSSVFWFAATCVFASTPKRMAVDHSWCKCKKVSFRLDRKPGSIPQRQKGNMHIVAFFHLTLSSIQGTRRSGIIGYYSINS